MSQRKRLALIDGHALAFRAFFALKDSGMRSSRGEPTYAVFGFAQIMLTMIQEQRPEYVAISFDVGRTFRDDLYAEYKAGRAETPEEFNPQLARIQELCRVLNIPIYVADGFEADDVIGTLSRQATSMGVETLILTGDTDSLQLVDDHVRVILANPYGQKTTTTIYDEEKVRERYKGLAPSQLADLRGLKGDASDNIPGVKGIGEAGAIALLNQFGTVESLYDRLDEAPNRYKKPLGGQREAAVFSKKLATIVCDAPVQLSLEDAAVHDYDRAAVIRLFQELELGASSGLLKKLPGSAAGAVAEQPLPAAQPAAGPTQQDMFGEALPAALDAAPPAAGAGPAQLSLFGDVAAPPAEPGRPALGDYRAVTTEAELEALVRALEAAPAFAFDTEASGLRPFASQLCGISIAVSPGSAVYVPCGHAEGQQLPPERVIAALRPFFEDPAKGKYAHNAKFDIEMLLTAGIAVRGLAFDTMVVAALLGKRAGLKDLAFYELGLPDAMTPIEDLIGRGSKQITFDKVPIAAATPYAAADADMTLRLVQALEPQLAQHESLDALFRRLELPLVDVLVRMEQAGIAIDKPYMEGLRDRLGERIATIEGEIHAIAGGPFNINSGDQLSDVLFGKLGLPTAGVERTAKTKKYSITADTLEKLRAEDTSGICERILEYRQLSKLKSTYVDALPGMVNPRTGRVHTSYNQVGAATGRLSCLPEGTLVNTQRGLVGIEEVQPGDLVRTAFGPQRVLAWQATGLKPVVALRLSNGITLRCSPEHRLRSLGQWVHAADLAVGDPLYMSHAPGIFGQEIALDLHYTSHYDTRKTTSLPNEWSVELAELIGYHIADGHIAHSNYNGKPAKISLAFGWEDEELIAYFADAIFRLFGKEPTRRTTRSCPVLDISSVDVGGMFEQLGAGGKSGVIRVPPSIYRAPEPIVAGFLRGYFEGDGSVAQDIISVRSVSMAMLEDVQQLLTLFGITSRIGVGSPDPRGYAPRHILRIAGRRSNAIFHERIGFLSTKKHLLCAVSGRMYEEPHTSHSSADLITLTQGFDMRAIKPALHAAVRAQEGYLPQSLQVITSKIARGDTRTITSARASWIISHLPSSMACPEADFLREAVDGSYLECKIISIEHGPPVPMYDIAVDNIAQYIANGVVVHNSIDPNLQNIPVRTQEGREIRRGFVAAPGHTFVAADYSQIELRILAYITRDPSLVRAFQEGQDIHAATASQLFGVAIDKVDKNQRRIAKCVAAGTLVLTEQGLVPIEKLGTAEIDSVTDLQLGVAQEGKGRHQATGFYNGGVKPTIRITTERGYQLEATTNHRVRVLNAFGDYSWRWMDELKAGDYVALARGALLFGQDQPLDITYQRRNDRKLRLPERLSPDLARFLGYFVAEGNVVHGRTSSSLVIANKDVEVLDDLRSLSERLFDYAPRELVDKNGVTSMRWNCSRLVELVDQLGVGSGAANKLIPDVVMRGSYESVSEFLRAYFEGDGSISKSFISAGSKSERLMRQLQSLLLNFGIVAYLEHRDIPNYGRHYKLRLIGRESRALFAEHIGFISTRKSQRLVELLTRRVTHEALTLPYQAARLERMYPKTKRELKELIHTCIRTKSPTIQLTYRRLGAILDQFPEPDDDDAQELREHLSRNLFYDRVATIEHGESQVYDLVVPETNTYIANGFVSHNTVVFGVIYGISAFGLAQRTELSRGESQALIDGLFERFPGIREYITRTLEQGQATGYVNTLFGRRRNMPELQTRGPRRAAAEREAINAPIQGTAADIMKIAMVNMLRALDEGGLRTRLLLQVHDELILEAPDDEVEAVKKLVCDVMEGAYELKWTDEDGVTQQVPLGVDVETGPNWEEMR